MSSEWAVLLPGCDVSSCNQAQEISIRHEHLVTVKLLVLAKVRVWMSKEHTHKIKEYNGLHRLLGKVVFDRG